MDALRQIPPVHEVRQSSQLDAFRGILETSFAAKILDDVIHQIRTDLVAGGAAVPRAELTARIADETARRLAEAFKPSLRRVINASGVVLHTNLGRAPLPACAIDHLRDVATGYSNLEFALEGGSRG